MSWNRIYRQALLVFAAALMLIIGAAAEAQERNVNRMEIVLPLESVQNYESFDGGLITRWNRNKKFNFAGAQISVNGKDLQAAQIEFRGQTCEGARRPCLGLEVDDKLKVGSVKGKKFDLNSLIGDKGYINNKIGFGLVGKLGLEAIPNEFVELSMRDPDGKLKFNMGLYLIMPKPTQYAMKELNAEFLARKRYKYVETKKVSDSASISAETYQAELNEMYRATKANEWHGQELLGRVEKLIDLDAYLKWLALNSLLRNGDYSDEIFFVGTAKDGKPFFNILPWDYDDLFGSIHSIPFYTTSCKNFKWAPIHNCESPLDRALVKDRVAYKHLLEVFQATLLYDLPKSLTDAHLDAVAYEVYPYLLLPEVSEVAKKDGRSLEYDWTSIHRLIQARKNSINERRTILLRQIDSELERIAN